MNDDQNTPTTPAGWQYRPGDSVAPNTSTPAPARSMPQTQAPVPDAQVQQASVQESTPNATYPAEGGQPDAAPLSPEFAEDALLPDEAGEPGVPVLPADAGYIEWTASEYVAHEKTIKWYAVLMLSSILAAVAAYFLTKDVISAVSIVLMALVFALLASHKPRVLTYRLDVRGLTIERKMYGYDQFRSFALIDEGAFSSIMLVPLKRFMPMISLYYEPADEDRIVKMLADRLPLEQRNRDAIDALLHKIRF
jgi:hypothetical protein